MRCFFYLIFLITLISCSSKKDTKYDKIQYNYHDGPVTPQYHRDFSIIATPKNLRFKVTSYNEIIKDTIITITEEKWNQITSSFQNCKISNSKKTYPNPGCVGGHGVSILAFSPENRVFSGYNWYCGGEISGDMTGEIENFLDSLKLRISDDFFNINL